MPLQMSLLKKNDVKINNNNGGTEFDTNKNIKNKTKHNNEPSCNISGKSV